MTVPIAKPLGSAVRRSLGPATSGHRPVTAAARALAAGDLLDASTFCEFLGSDPDRLLHAWEAAVRDQIQQRLDLLTACACVQRRIDMHAQRRLGGHGF
jgi:hypothetical protein